MTISSTDNRISYSGNGSTTPFAFPYLFFADDDLNVILVVDATGVETTQVLDTDYTVADAGEESGGTVTMITAPANGETLVIIREEQLKQELDLVENDPLPAEELEKAFDKSVMMAQQNATEIARSFKLPDGDTSGADTTIPAPEALKSFRWDAAGTALEAVDDPGTSADDAAASAAAALVSENAAQSSEDDAQTAEGNATTQAGLAAASAAAAQAAADSVAWDVERIVFADSPVTAEGGKMYVCDTSDGNIVINLPSIAAVGEPTSIAMRKETGDLNTITATPNGTDTVEDAASYVIDGVSAHTFHADIDTTPDNWAAVNMGGTLANPRVENFVKGADFSAGVSTTITLSQSVDTENAVWIQMDGLSQHHDTFTISGTTVTFDAVIPASTDDIEVHYFETVQIGVPADASITSDKLTGPMRLSPTTDNDGNFDMDVANDFLWTPAAADELDFTNRTTGQRGLVLLVNPSAYAITFGANFYGSSSAAADLSAAGTYQISYWCSDGTDIYLSYSQAQVAI